MIIRTDRQRNVSGRTCALPSPRHIPGRLGLVLEDVVAEGYSARFSQLSATLRHSETPGEAEC